MSSEDGLRWLVFPPKQDCVKLAVTFWDAEGSGSKTPTRAWCCRPEATPNPNNTEDWYGEAQYGFYDLTISKTEILIESINYDSELLLSYTVYPK